MKMLRRVGGGTKKCVKKKTEKGRRSPQATSEECFLIPERRPGAYGGGGWGGERASERKHPGHAMHWKTKGLLEEE